MAVNSLYPGQIGARAASLAGGKVIAAPLIELLKIGPRYDPAGAASPNFGSKVFHKVQGRKNTRQVVKKPEVTSIGGLAKKIGGTRKSQKLKESGKGGVLDITA